ncbi:hypothetical protein, partial [Neobacillus kokaensis]|uniref:hypothetical protein n=1 Tax=Neobacillus kokaensis TaxID=2759023 RepID=UPI001EFF53E7
FLHLRKGRLRSEGRLQLKLGRGLEILQGQPFDGLFLEDEIDRALSLGWGLYKSQSLSLRSRCIHSFSIIGDPLL